MEKSHRVPWFPAWGVRFREPIDDPMEVVTLFNEWRPNERWLLMAFDVAASEVHLWTVWHALRRREISESMTSRAPDTEFLRILSGTHQIRTAFERAGLTSGDEKAWIVHIPELEIGDGFANIELPRDIYNDNTKEFERLQLHLKASLVVQRPRPSNEGLVRIGVRNNGDEISFEHIENAFLNHAAMADMHG